MMFGEIVSQIIIYIFLKDVVTALKDSILDPIKTYINGFGAFLVHIIVDNVFTSWVFSLRGCCRLGV